ncbi:hypothetical protein F5146DRAFT_1152033 [Armillaria mellea]|nr:hypothetical protein F5146DRAFT_1152033 [Armillaria mellea]
MFYPTPRCFPLLPSASRLYRSFLPQNLDRYRDTMAPPILEKNRNRAFKYCEVPGCGRKFADGTGVSRHKRDHNPNAKRYPCPNCGKVWKQKSNLNDHIRSVHEKKKPFKCSVPGCNKKFSTRGYRTRHQTRCRLARANRVIYTGPTPLLQRLVPATDAETAFDDIDTPPSFPQSDSNAGSPDQHMSTSTPSQSQFNVDSDMQDILSPSLTPSPPACGLYLPEMVIPSTTSTTNLLFVGANGGVTDPLTVHAGFPRTSAPSHLPIAPFLSTSPVIEGGLLPPLSFNSLNSSFRSFDNELHTGSNRLLCDIMERLDLDLFASSSSFNNERLLPASSFDYDRSSSSDSSSSSFEELLTPLLFETEQFTPKASAFDETFLSPKESLDAFQFPIF